jgi:hypothetical protein
MLNKRSQKTPDFPYLNTPNGIVTPRGHVFRTTEELLDEYAGELFKKYSKGDMLKKASAWIESTDGAGIILMLIFLLWLPPLPAAAASLLTAWVWHKSRSMLAGPGLTGFVKVIGNDFMQLLVALAPLSWFGMQGMYTHLAAGFLLFFLFKFGWFRMLVGKISTEGTKRPGTGLNDRILNMLITRFAIREGITLKNIEKMEQDLAEAVRKSEEQRKKFRKKKKS